MATIEEKYPGLIDSVLSAAVSHTTTFVDDETYAAVSTESLLATNSGVENYINWILQPISSENDVELISPTNFIRFTIIKSVEEEPKDSASITSDDLTSIKVVDELKPIEPLVYPPLISIDRREFQTPVILDRPSIFERNVIRIGGGENSQGNPRLGSFTSRGGVLGGINFTNPQDAIDNEFRFRERIDLRQF